MSDMFQPSDQTMRATLAHHDAMLRKVQSNGNGGFADHGDVHRPLSQIAWRSIIWLDKPFLQRGAFHLLVGKKGSTKGTYTCGLAAKVSRGEYFDGPRSVILVSSEDSAAVDIGPRVGAAQGDSDRIHVVTADFRLPRDIPLMKQWALQIGETGLIVIDPLGNHLINTDTDGEGSVRDAIAGLNALADDLDCVVIGVRHLGKDVSRGALASVLGSTAWIDVPRAVIAMAADDEDDMIFHAQVIAGNRGPKGAGREFHLEMVDVGLLEPVTYLRHNGESSKDVEELLGGKLVKNDSRSQAARELILDLLDGVKEMESDTLTARVCQETGLAASTVKNVRTRLRDEGLMRVFPDKDEAGKVVRWNAARTAAPRPEPVLPDTATVSGLKPDTAPRVLSQTFGLNTPDNFQVPTRSVTVSGDLVTTPDTAPGEAPPRTRAREETGESNLFLTDAFGVEEAARLEALADEYRD